MYFVKNTALSALIISSCHAFSLPEISLPDTSILTRTLPLLSKKDGGNGGCPPVWTNVVNDLSQMFLDTATSQCNDDARAAIREMFHDCGTWSTDQGNTGGCDGSLILANEAFTRGENNGLQDISTKLLNLARKWNVGVADIIVVAANVAVKTCPLGPKINTFVGRKDSSVPAPDGKLPDMHAAGESLRLLFLAKGLSANDLAALIGAHTSSKSFHQTPAGVGDIGSPQDSTPGIWDVKYYSEVTSPAPGDFVFESDKNLAANPIVGKEFSGFVNNQGKWTSAFADAMFRMSLFGVPGGKSNLIDCTGILPRGTTKRDIRAAPINDRAR